MSPLDVSHDMYAHCNHCPCVTPLPSPPFARTVGAPPLSQQEAREHTQPKARRIGTHERTLCRPRACYDEGKRVAETMMYSYQQQNNVDIRVARIFNTFGEREEPAILSVLLFAQACGVGIIVPLVA